MRQSPQRPSAWKRLLSWCRRHPLWTAAIIIAIVVIGSVSNATSSPSTTQTSSTPTATSRPVQQTAQETAGPTVDVFPTDAPIPTPTPSPTQKPTPTPKPTPVVIHPTPTPMPPKPTPTHCVGISNNPWCYDFNPGNLITNPPSNFCSYFACIGNFWNGHGYVNECQDGTYSKSGGIRGDCSDHGGYYRTLYSH